MKVKLVRFPKKSLVSVVMICFNIIALLVYVIFCVKHLSNIVKNPSPQSVNVIIKNDKSKFETNIENGTAKTMTKTENDDACIRIEPLDPSEVPINKSLFFIESTKRASISMTARQACSVESAARANPDSIVYVLCLSSKFQCRGDLTAIFTLVTNFNNIRIRHIDVYTYVNGTPLENFIRSGIMDEEGIWPVEQHSDMLRLVTLWKFGGIYIDLDMIILKPLPFINFIGAEYPGNSIGSNIIGIQNKDILEKAMLMFIDGWDGRDWAKNGPILFTNLMKELCGVNNVPYMHSGKADCKHFTVYPPHVLGPIDWDKWPVFFDENKNQYVKEKIKNSMAVHFVSHMSKRHPIIPSSNQPYANIAKKYCPKVLNTVINYF